MKFLRNWLRPERPQGVAMHPARTIVLDAAPAAVFDRCAVGIEQVLGGNISARDAHAGVIEATFGLVNSERMTVSIQTLDGDRSRVSIESRRGALAQQPLSSNYVDALASFLQQ